MWKNVFVFLLLILCICAIGSEEDEEEDVPNRPRQRFTRERRPGIVRDGFIWNLFGKKTINNGRNHVWACAIPQCSARAWSPVDSPIDSVVLEIRKQHTHRRSATKIEIQAAQAKMKEAARNSDRSTRLIAAEITRGLSDNALTQWSNAGAAKMIQDQRKIPGRRFVDSENIDEIVLDGVFTKDIDGNPFLRYDSRQQEPNEPPYFLFISDNGIIRLTRFPDWSSDGTFKITPANFFQLFTINVLIDQSSIPSAFVLMTDKTQRSYERILRKVQEITRAAPRTTMMDFEIAQRNAYQNVFDGVQIRHCLFHLAQSIHRNVKSRGLSRVYEQHQGYNKVVRSLAALSLLPVEDVGFVYDNLLDELGNLDLSEYVPEDQDIIDPYSVFEYFKRTYIETDLAAPAIYPVETWNHHELQLDGRLGRTNNAQEAYHCALNKRFSGAHPALSKVIVILQEEDSAATTKIRIRLIDDTHPVNLYPRSVKHIAVDQRIHRKVVNYQQMTDADDPVGVAFVFSIQNLLYERGFDNWD